MDTPHDDTRRLTDLEIKASYMEDLLDELNLTIWRQQQRIDNLVEQVAQLRAQQNPDGGGAAAARNLRDELPPHY